MIDTQVPNKLRSVIVDDIRSSRQELHELLVSYCPEIDVVHQSDNIQDACRFMDSDAVDVVFLDIQMPGGSGFELLEKYEQREFQVVFVTGYEHYSLRAIKMNALDYLVKPVVPDELQLAVRRLAEVKRKQKNLEVIRLSLQHFREQTSGKKRAEHITLHHLGGFDIVNIKDILYLKAERGYTVFVINDGRKIMVSKTIKTFDELLSDYHFIRIHKSYLVNLYSIQKYKHEDVGWVIMSNGDRLEVSRRRNAEFMAAVNAMKIIGA